MGGVYYIKYIKSKSESGDEASTHSLTHSALTLYVSTYTHKPRDAITHLSVPQLQILPFIIEVVSFKMWQDCWPEDRSS